MSSAISSMRSIDRIICCSVLHSATSHVTSPDMLLQHGSQMQHAAPGSRMTAATLQRSSVFRAGQAVSWRRCAAQRCRHVTAHRRPTVMTSEHWWEDEEEFDGLTDSIKPKNLLLVAAPAAGGEDAAITSLRAAVDGVPFNLAVSGAETLSFAQQLWQGRDGPPYFYKVRSRWVEPGAIPAVGG